MYIASGTDNNANRIEKQIAKHSLIWTLMWKRKTQVNVRADDTVYGVIPPSSRASVSPPRPFTCASMRTETALSPSGIRSWVSVPLSLSTTFSLRCLKIPEAVWNRWHAFLMPCFFYVVPCTRVDGKLNIQQNNRKATGDGAGGGGMRAR